MKKFIESNAGTILVATIITMVIVILTAGCSALVPNTVTPFAEHVSHLTQHAPFAAGDKQTHYGYEQLGVAARWEVYKGAFFEMSEGINPGRKNTGGEACDALYGGREVFTARVGYTFRLK